MTALIEARQISAGYGGVEIVHDLSLEVQAGEVVALLGANGAGKTTTLLTLAGELAPLGGEVLMDGERTTAPLHRRARKGLAFVTEERSIFPKLTTRQNLAVARADVEQATALFPELVPLMSRRSSLLSGGEAQMLTLSRALARAPSLLLADELSLGLAPKTVGPPAARGPGGRGSGDRRAARRAARSPRARGRRPCLPAATGPGPLRRDRGGRPREHRRDPGDLSHRPGRRSPVIAFTGERMRNGVPLSVIQGPVSVIVHGPVMTLR